MDAKDNECAAILAIVERLDIKAALVTIDAIATNPAVARAVTAAGGDYLLALKRNPPSLHDEVKAYFADPSTPGLATFTTTDKDHGRIETRTTRVSHDVGWMTGQRRHPGEHRFPALASLIETTTRTERRGRITRDTRLFHLLGAPDPRARRPGHPQPLGRGEPALGAGRDLQGGSVPPAQGTRRPEHGPGAKAGLQHGPGRPRQTIHQDRPKGRRMEPRRPRLNPPASIVLTRTRRRAAGCEDGRVADDKLGVPTFSRASVRRQHVPVASRQSSATRSAAGIERLSGAPWPAHCAPNPLSPAALAAACSALPAS